MTKDFLGRGILVNKLIKAKICEIDNLKMLKKNISASRFYEFIDGNKKITKIGEIDIKIINYENMLNEDIDKLIDIKNDIKLFIEYVKSEELLSILTLKYLSFNTFEEIAEILNYSERQIYRLHKKALNELELHKYKLVQATQIGYFGIDTYT